MIRHLQEYADFRCAALRNLDFLQYKDGLPIYAKKKEFLDVYRESQVLIMKSSAGSGKSTQMPQYLLQSARGKILVTQPRVIAAESVAKRVREELKRSGLKEEIVGYVAGPNFNVKPDITEIVYITEVKSANQSMNLSTRSSTTEKSFWRFLRLS